MGYESGLRTYALDELDISSSPSDGPFISENNVTRGPGLQKLTGASASPASIWQNDEHPWEGGEILRFRFAAKLPTAHAASDESFLGLAGDKAAIGSLARAIGFHLDGDGVIKCAMINGGVLTEEASAFTLGNAWRKFEIDLYTGLQSVGPPGESKGGIGAIKFSVENDRGQLTPIGLNTAFDMSNHASDRFQILFTTETSNSSEVDLKFAEIEYRNLPGS